MVHLVLKVSFLVPEDGFNGFLRCCGAKICWQPSTKYLVGPKYYLPAIVFWTLCHHIRIRGMSEQGRENKIWYVVKSLMVLQPRSSKCP